MREPDTRRAVITGMSINTPLGDGLGQVLEAMLAGKSAVGAWTSFPTDGILAKIGGDLGAYDVEGKIQRLSEQVPSDMLKRARTLLKKVPWSTKLSILVALDAWVDAFGAGRGKEIDPERLAVLVASTDISLNYEFEQFGRFATDPDDIEPLYPVYSLDTDHAACISEVLGAKGGAWVIGGACASGNLALKQAADEVRYHDLDAVFVVGPVCEFSPMFLHALGLLGALSTDSFNDQPVRASRPFDTRREGFVPAHAAAVTVVESLAGARTRGAAPRAEIIKVASNADAKHLPTPSLEGQLSLLQKLFRDCPVRPEDIDLVSMHATSTPLGDVAEVESLTRFFGAHAERLVVNAPKSMLGHPTGSAAVVELVIAVLELQAQRVHPSINIDELDPRVTLDVVAEGARSCRIRHVLKNSFGFGGINCSSLLAALDDS